VEELLARGATAVVLSLGMNRRLEVDPRTLDCLAGRSVAAHLAETREAVKIYNDLAEAVPVAGLFPLDLLTPRQEWACGAISLRRHCPDQVPEVASQLLRRRLLSHFAARPVPRTVRTVQLPLTPRRHA
jgi:hypothetical protein